MEATYEWLSYFRGNISEVGHNNIGGCMYSYLYGKPTFVDKNSGKEIKNEQGVIYELPVDGKELFKEIVNELADKFKNGFLMQERYILERLKDDYSYELKRFKKLSEKLNGLMDKCYFNRDIDKEMAYEMFIQIAMFKANAVDLRLKQYSGAGRTYGYRLIGIENTDLLKEFMIKSLLHGSFFVEEVARMDNLVAKQLPVTFLEVIRDTTIDDECTADKELVDKLLRGFTWIYLNNLRDTGRSILNKRANNIMLMDKNIMKNTVDYVFSEEGKDINSEAYRYGYLLMKVTKRSTDVFLSEAVDRFTTYSKDGVEFDMNGIDDLLLQDLYDWDMTRG